MVPFVVISSDIGHVGLPIHFYYESEFKELCLQLEQNKYTCQAMRLGDEQWSSPDLQ